VSVKTRIGYDVDVAESWMGELARCAPVAVTLHGRTLAQLYGGQADWAAIGRAARVARAEGIIALGNGDLPDRATAEARVREFDLDGALIGRATVGNPWVLGGLSTASIARLRVAIEHSEWFESALPDRQFMALRKHLHGYCRGFEGAGELRNRLMRAPNAPACRDLIDDTIRRLAAYNRDETASAA
jgi:tRNA-dihydrouridine synthase